MSTTRLSDALARQAVEALAAHGGNVSNAAMVLGMSRGTFQSRLQVARARGMLAAKSAEASPSASPPAPVSRDVEMESLRRQLRDAQAGESLQAWAKALIQAADERAQIVKPATWLREHTRTPQAAGIPTLLLSDLHWGEVVRAAEIGGINEYSMEIARQRLHTVVTKAVTLLRDHVVGNYPGIVVALGGDMVSGAIHDELEQTNDGTVMVQMLDLFEHLQTALRLLADEFGKVHVPAVTGNHGRSNKKWQAKQRAHLSYEWLMYQFLQRALSDDKRITFQIGDGPDVDYDLLGTRYRLTHGDSFKGGDSIIGAVGPITRGALKRSRMASVMGAPFDYLLMGHWHTLIWGANYIVNGSLKGYDEYAMSFSATPEKAAQALWLTAEGKGRTIQIPVFA